MIGGVKGVCSKRWLNGGGVRDVKCSGSFVRPYRTHQHPRAVCRSVWLRRALKMRVAYINNAHDLELWYFQILADLFGKSIYNLDIERNSRCLHVRWIVEDSVLPTFSKKLAPMLLQMAKLFVKFIYLSIYNTLKHFNFFQIKHFSICNIFLRFWEKIIKINYSLVI